MKKEKTKQNNSKNIVYILIIVFSLVALISVLFMTVSSMQANKEKKQELDKIQEEFNELATLHENLNDDDYANVYFDGNKQYIPSDKLIIEYRP